MKGLLVLGVLGVLGILGVLGVLGVLDVLAYCAVVHDKRINQNLSRKKQLDFAAFWDCKYVFFLIWE